jgi:signal transduction histidine kinase
MAIARISLARQFLLASFVTLLAGMLVIGGWISYQIENRVLNRTAAITALYVDSFVSPRIQALADDQTLSPEVMEGLDLLITGTALGEQIVSFKIWSDDGRIIYSADRTLIGAEFGVGDELASALDGEVVSSIARLNKPEHSHERERWDHLIETYAPVRREGSQEVLAVSEFYQLPEDLESQIRTAQFQSWVVVGLATLLMYVLLAGMVGRASGTIQRQQSELEEHVSELKSTLRQNEDLRQRVQRAGARTTAINERFLRRLSSDLHDGMGQDLTLALMRIEAFRGEEANETDRSIRESLNSKDVEIIHTALNSAVRELRATTDGLRLPELEDLEIDAVARRAINAFESKTGLQVRSQLQPVKRSWPMPFKITLYRVIQEALTNSYRHSNGANREIKLYEEDGHLLVQVSDDGDGFDLGAATNSIGLGLVGMRERVELLGGTYNIEAAPGHGTVIKISLPLEGWHW